MDFAPIPGGVSWTSPPLFFFTAERLSLEARFGPPQLRDLDSNGVGLFDAWLVRFPCGLEVALWVFARSEYNVEVYANGLDASHILHHLALPHAELARFEPDPCPPVSARFAVMRLDDNGGIYEVTRATSTCEAEAVRSMYEARGHKQAYWVETLPPS